MAPGKTTQQVYTAADSQEWRLISSLQGPSETKNCRSSRTIKSTSPPGQSAKSPEEYSPSISLLLETSFASQTGTRESTFSTLED